MPGAKGRANGDGVFLGADENVLKLDSGDGYSIVNILVTIGHFIRMKFMAYELYFNKTVIFFKELKLFINPMKLKNNVRCLFFLFLRLKA